MKLTLALVVLALGLSPALAMADEQVRLNHLFRYYDDKHQEHIDQLVSDQALIYGYDELDQNMAVIRTVPPRLTGKDLERVKADQRRRQQEEEQAERDATLRRLYSSPDDAVRDRDSQMEAIQVHLEFANSTLNSLRSERASNAEHAAGFERNGLPVPQATLDKIKNYDKQILAEETDIKDQETQRDSIHANFEPIIKRLQDLQQARSSGTASSNSGDGSPATP